MEVTRLYPECVSCLIKKQLTRYPEDISDDVKMEYMQSVLRIVSEADRTMSAPEVVSGIYALQRSMFGSGRDYTDIKRYFNDLMLELEDDIRTKAERSEDPLLCAVQYSVIGNYIDFAAMENVDENELKRLLSGSGDVRIDAKTLEALRADIKNASRLAVLTDNCGEIVLDKILISVIKDINPDIDVSVIVRGYPVINDATTEDAEQVGLDKAARIIPNGSRIGGNVLHRISAEAKGAIDNADVIVSKGQANFETLYKCGKNIYYIFMCKCTLFSNRFNVPRFTGMLINDSSL